MHQLDMAWVLGAGVHSITEERFGGPVNGYWDTAINAACAQGGAVLIPPLSTTSAYYEIGDTCYVPSGTILFGLGPRSKLKAKANFGDKPAIRNTTYSAANDGARDTDIHLHNFALDVNRDNNTSATEFSHAVQLQAVLRGSVSKLYIKECKGDGVYVGAAQGGTTVLSEDVRVLHNLIEDCYRNGVSLTAGSRLYANFNTVSRAGLNGIDIEPDGSLNPNLSFSQIYGNIITATDGSYSGATGAGIAVTSALGFVTQILVAKNILNTIVGHGIAFRGCADLDIVDNTIKSPTLIGINHLAGAANDPERLRVRGNRVISAGTIGVAYAADDAAFFEENLIVSPGTYGFVISLMNGGRVTGNTVLTATANDGILLQGVRNSKITNNISKGHAGRGIYLLNSGATQSTNNQVDDNFVENNTGGGIIEGASSDTNVIVKNKVENNTGAAITKVGSGTMVRHNDGWVTENQGTGSIASGATTAVVTHGLSATPTVANIHVTFAEQGTNDYGRWWISTITSTQFTVNVSADPGASNLDFGWQAHIL